MKTEPIIEPKSDSAAAAPPEAAVAPALAVQDMPKTKGEKFYDVFQFFAGKVFIIGATAVLAFSADQKYSPDKFGAVPNYLKRFQGWFHNKLLHNKAYPLADKGDFANLFAAAGANTMIISHGGNLFGPFVQWLENNREGISNWYNRKYGTPQEVEIAHERLKDIPKQNAADIVKGRVLTWGTVFAAMLATYTVVGKNPKSGRYWLDIYEDWFARKLAGLSHAGKEIAAMPVSRELSEAQQGNAAYRFGKVLALDLYATTAGILLWNMFSRRSAAKRTQKEQLEAEYQAPLEWQIPGMEDATVKKPHAERTAPQLKEGYAEMARQGQDAAVEISA